MSGSGPPPGLSLWGLGNGGKRTARRSACPRQKSGKISPQGGAVNSRQEAPQRLPLPQWAYESREKNSPSTGAAPPSRRRFPASGRSFTASVFPATKPDNPGTATDFALCLQYRRRSRTVPCYTSAAAMGQLLFLGNLGVPTAFARLRLLLHIFVR